MHLYDRVSSGLQRVSLEVEHVDGSPVVIVPPKVEFVVDTFTDDEDIPLIMSCIYALPVACVGVTWIAGVAVRESGGLGGVLHAD